MKHLLRILLKIIDSRAVIPLISSIVFLYIYKIANGNYFSILGCLTSITAIFASLNSYSWNKCPKKFINLTVLLYPILFFVPILNICYGFIFIVFLAMTGGGPSTQNTQSSSNDTMHNYIMEKEAKKQTRLMEQQLENAKLDYQQNLSCYGLPKPQLPPGGYKLCRIFAINHDGTSSTFHHIGLEHEARKMFENDPRFREVMVSVDSLNEWGHYGMI